MNRYNTPEALRRALEDRLITLSRLHGGADLQRMRRQVAFDRLLSRLFAVEDPPWLLKGGYAMELRLRSARSTRDVDLALRTDVSGTPRWEEVTVRRLLEEGAARLLGDGFDFWIGAAVKELEAAPYGGARFPVVARMAGRDFARFHLDVSVGDVLREPFEILEGQDWLGFAGIASARLLAISREEQFAEKVHAFSLPRGERVNSRVRDLVDLALLVRFGGLDAALVRLCVEATFRRRVTHAVPAVLPAPPAAWAGPFAELSNACGLNLDLREATALVTEFFSQALRGPD